MELRGNWADLIAGVGLELDEVFNQAQEEYQPGIFALLNRVTGSGAQRNVTGKTGVGKISLFDDGDDVPQKNRVKTYTTQIVYNNYGGFLEVSKNTIEDRDFQKSLMKLVSWVSLRIFRRMRLVCSCSMVVLRLRLITTVTV